MKSKIFFCMMMLGFLLFVEQSVGFPNLSQQQKESNLTDGANNSSTLKRSTVETQDTETLDTEIPDTIAGKVLEEWLKAHNSADETSISAWMKKSFSPQILKRMDFDKHLAWYVGCTKMFGKLNEAPIKIVENKENRLVVQFASVDLKGEKNLDPTKVIIVKVDMDPAQPRFLAKGLGIGPLACEIRR